MKIVFEKLFVLALLDTVLLLAAGNRALPKREIGCFVGAVGLRACCRRKCGRGKKCGNGQEQGVNAWHGDIPIGKV